MSSLLIRHPGKHCLSYSISYPTDWGIIEQAKHDRVRLVGRTQVVTITVGPNRDALPLATLAPQAGLEGRLSAERKAGLLPALLAQSAGPGNENCRGLLAANGTVVYTLWVDKVAGTTSSAPEPICEIFETFSVNRDANWDNVVQAWLRLQVDPLTADEQAGQHWALAGKFVNEGRIFEAEREYRASIRFAPSDARPRDQLARILADSGRLPEAVGHATVAVYLAPRNSDHHALLGSVYDQQHRTELATEEFMKSIELDPANPVPHWSLGRMLGVMGQREGAITEMREAVRISGTQQRYSEIRAAAEQSIATLSR